MRRVARKPFVEHSNGIAARQRSHPGTTRRLTVKRSLRGVLTAALRRVPPSAPGGAAPLLAVEHLPPSAVVFCRTVLGAAFLLPLVARSRAFRGLRRVLVPIAVVTVLNMAAPTFLTAWGEQHVSSSAAGILTATDPLFAALLAL
jgi:drug/metabolite transporter (DMT)-like permease